MTKLTSRSFQGRVCFTEGRKDQCGKQLTLLFVFIISAGDGYGDLGLTFHNVIPW